MKKMTIDGIEFQTIDMNEVRGKLTYDIKVIALGGNSIDSTALIWSNIPGFELQGIVMTRSEFSAYCTILTKFNYKQLQDWRPANEGHIDGTYIRIFKYAKV